MTEKSDVIEDIDAVIEDADNVEPLPDPFFEYLKSAKGHEIFQRVIGIFEDIKKATLDRSSDHAKFEKLLQVVIILVVVLATSLLTYFEKFDSSVGVLFGTLVGYLFGKK